jgi:hypothetical protein
MRLQEMSQHGLGVRLVGRTVGDRKDNQGKKCGGIGQPIEELGLELVSNWILNLWEESVHHRPAGGGNDNSFTIGLA